MPSLIDQLTKYERDLVREAQHQPAVSARDLKPYIAKVWDWEGYERSRGYGDNIENAIASQSYNHPTWTREQLITIYAFQNLNGPMNAELGFTRQIILDDPSELARGIFLGARVEWLNRRTEEQMGCGRHLDDAIVAMLALPLMDMPLIERVLDAPLSEHDPIRQLLYEGVMATLRKDQKALARVIERFNKRKVHPAYQGMRTCLTGIAQNDSALVTRGLTENLDYENYLRKRKESSGMSLEAHEFWRLAQWVSPDLVSGFDVTQGMPWNAPFHAHIQEHPNPLEGWDLREIAPLAHDALVDLKLPAWWRVLDEPELPADPCRLTLIDLGPKAAQVRELLPELLLARRWPPVVFDTCPVVIAENVRRADAGQLAAGLRRLGASAEFERVG